jgi:hypothetical protein
MHRGHGSHGEAHSGHGHSGSPRSDGEVS